MIEIWKKVEGYPYYSVSNKGVIKKFTRVSKASVKANGYEYLALDRKKHYVHRVVAAAFIPNPNGFRCVNHKDGNKRNNVSSNLEWCTHSYNNAHAFSIGLRKPVSLHGNRNGCSKFTDCDVLSIRKEYSNNTTFASLGRKYNVTYNTISDIIRRKTWRHI